MAQRTQGCTGAPVADAADVQRRLVAVFAADVEGYSRLMGADEVGTLKGLTERRAILDRAIAEHRGRIANTAGDSVLAEFGSAVDAVQCAVEAQAALAEANASLSTDKRINFRIGIHVGDVMVRAGDLFGDGVNIAARLQALGQPGGVCVSGTTYEQVRKVLPVAFTDLGAQQVRNIEEPVRAYSVKFAEGGAPASAAGTWKALPLPDKPSIAVLPFDNLSGDVEQTYFCDGIVEDIITALSRFKSLFVIARNSSFTYKGKAVDIKQVGRELGVRYVLEGSVRKAGNRVRITGQLIEAASGAHVWADKFDGALDDVFDLQDQVTTRVVGAIAPTIEQSEIERAKRKPTEQLDSYDLFLKGMALAYRRSTQTDAQNFFRRALEKDPDFAVAHAMVSYVSLMRLGDSGALSHEERDEALKSAEHAARLAPDDASVLARVAHVFAYIGHDYTRSASMAERAITLNPNLAAAWYSRGWISVMRVEPERALESFAQMQRLSPLDPLRGGALFGAAFAYWFEAKYSDGCIVATEAMNVGTNAHSLVSFILNALPNGRAVDARDAATRLLELHPNFRLADAHRAFPMQKAEWRNRVEATLREAGIPE